MECLRQEKERIPDATAIYDISAMEESWKDPQVDSNTGSTIYNSLVKKPESKNGDIMTSIKMRKERIEKFTQRVNSNWPNRDVDIEIKSVGSSMTLIITSDTNGDVITTPEDRSEGFRWFLSFCIEVLFSDTEEDILLLDDPGSGLHPEANKKVRDALENFAENTQTAYSTHSPYMLDTSDLDSIRLVQRENSETTEIVDDLSKVETDSPDALAPVRARLGAKHADSLFASKQNIIVEGFTDRKYLEAFSEFLGDGEPVLPDQLSITDASGGGNIETLAKMVIAEGYDYAILLDDDRGGQSSKENLLDAGIPEENIVMVSDAHDDDESSNDTIEDLLDDDVAIEALAQMHDSFDEDDLRGEIDGREHFPKRVISRLRELEGTEELDDPPTEMDRLAKGGMAEYVTRKVETGQWEEPELGGETVERFETLLEDVLAVLESDDE
jgi:predicted ATP-dependent endonuclease of OLD family